MTTDRTGAQAVDLSIPRRIHIVGVGGSGMSAIAEILIGTGHRVSGSDLAESSPLRRLAEAGHRVYVGHAVDQVGDAEFVAVSTAIPATNPEVVAARERGIPVLRRADILAAITRAWSTVSVAGTHGKTTTSAMLTSALRGAGLDPAFIVGGDLMDLGTGASVGTGDILVVEADESDGTFVELASTGIIVTNVEPDHLEHYGSFDNLKAAFARFVTEATGPKVVCLDDPGARDLISLIDSDELITYGTDPEARWRICDPVPTPVGISFVMEREGYQALSVSLRQPGMHNARNAVAAISMAIELGADPKAAATALSQFGGVGRRFEERGEANGVRLVDDYAHLPTEVDAALAAAKSLHPTRLIGVFQPHRFSRTEQLWSSFKGAFDQADLLVVTGIYSAGEAPRPGITGRLLADDVAAASPHLSVEYIEELDDVVSRLVGLAGPGDLIVTLGAGDLTRIPDRILAGITSKGVGDEQG